MRTTTTYRAQQAPRVPEWRRRQLEQLRANGGRIIASRVTYAGPVL